MNIVFVFYHVITLVLPSLSLQYFYQPLSKNVVRGSLITIFFKTLVIKV